MKVYKAILFILIICLCWVLFAGIRDFRSTRNRIDDLDFSLHEIKSHLPASTKIYYFSNYSPDFEFAYYFQTQFAMAPLVVIKGDEKNIEPGDYLVLAKSSDPERSLPQSNLKLHDLDTLYSLKIEPQQLMVYLLKKEK